MEDERQKSMLLINALKNGVVPDADLEFLCVGRGNVLNELQRCLDIVSYGGSTIKFICGEYGTGKSFLMSLHRQRTLAQNYVVSKIQIDNGFRFNNLEHLYYNIMHNIYIESSTKEKTGFENIFDLWISNMQAQEDRSKVSAEMLNIMTELNQYNSSFARALISYIRARIEKNVPLAEAVVSWITGEKNIPTALKSKFEVIGSIDKLNAIDFLKAFIKLIQLLGYKGIVILVDEMELIMNERIDIRRAAYENLRYLIDACYSGEIRNCMFAFTATNEFFDNPEKGIKTYQALEQRLGDAIDKNNSVLTDFRQPIIRLSGLNSADLQELTDRIVSIYKKVYPLDPKISNDSIKNWTLMSLKKFGAKLSELSIREYLTKLIEILDIMEQHPENKVFRAELKHIPKEK